MNLLKFLAAGIIFLFTCSCTSKQEAANHYSLEETASTKPDSVILKLPWLESYNVKNSLINRISVPAGYSRIEQDEKSFGFWLRRLPLKPGKPDVYLYNGTKKYNQSAHAAVFDIDPGTKDLQQCADAVMRLRAEYLLSQKRDEVIAFRFTSGDQCKWSEWKKGIRPVIKGNSVSWKQSAQPDDSYSSFKKYLLTVFTYAGSASLEKELTKKNRNEILPGDVWIKGGHPGHAVIVMDVATDKNNNRIFLLAQSYMPAQEIQLLKNPLSPAPSPWFSTKEITEELVTPEWTFNKDQLRSF